ncbi:MAG: hypothetical protein JWM59_4366 [Verrucomicrobiales bacterium]|nr:hypothetical protein [Verrucomicrobiales bacterium]
MMVPVARFTTREQAESFLTIASECGVAARILDLRGFSGGFDSTLGGADSLQGFSVEVKAEEVTALAAHLEAGMEIDPQDPMHSAGRDELTAIAEGPLDGNLCERIIASRILAGLPPERSRGVCGDPVAVDAWLAADGRMARWLGAAGLIFTAVYLTVMADRILFPDYRIRCMRRRRTHGVSIRPGE